MGCDVTEKGKFAEPSRRRSSAGKWHKGQTRKKGTGLEPLKKVWEQGFEFSGSFRDGPRKQQLRVTTGEVTGDHSHQAFGESL